MSYIQNTDSDRDRMLDAVGAGSVEELFSQIPESIRWKGKFQIPASMTEVELENKAYELAHRNVTASCRPSFLGAGSYRHFIPAVVDHLAGRSEFVTAYTPYQPEASQGALQAFFEYQTMICMLTGMEISNSSMYDGATALTEAALMAIGITRKKKLVTAATLHPQYRAVLATYLRHTDVEIVEVPQEKGVICEKALHETLDDETACFLFQSPNFFGCIEDSAALIDAAAARGALSAVSVDPISLSILEPPGRLGADITVGEGQSLGTPMSYGGPGFGFMATREKYIRQLPGRIVGKTKDGDGRTAYVLTFQTREQHIRRARATSNICTNHGLIALRASVYLAALGRTGFRNLGLTVAAGARSAAKRICAVRGFELAHDAPFFKEFTIRCPVPAVEVNRKLLEAGILGGFEAGKEYSGSEDLMILAVTEMTTSNDVDRLIDCLKGIS